MTPRISNRKSSAMTLTEVLVVVIILGFLVLIFFPWPEPTALKRAARINCVNNLKQIGLAYRIWTDDNNGKFPMEVSVTNGGTMELVVDGKNAWLNYLVMSNELCSPKLLVCPADSKNWPSAAIDFSTTLAGKISYFVGLDASTNSPQTFLSGDDNFQIAGVPVKSGLLEISTNLAISWSAARHHFAGNIGLADGSVQQLTQDGLLQVIQQTCVATNRLAIP